MTAARRWVTGRTGARAGPWPALAVVLVAAFMDYLDASISTAAVPTISRDLDASDAADQWMIAGYTLPFALMLITGGRLGDLYGRRRVFAIGLGGFTAASLLCGLAPNAGLLIGGRVLQGLAGAVMVPQVFAVIQLLFGPDRRGAAFSAFAGVTAVASVAGAPLGGLLIGADLFGLSWRTVFLVNVPIGLITLVAVALLLPESRVPDAARADAAGFALVTVGMTLIVLPIVHGAEVGWPAWTVVAMGAGAGVTALLLVVEGRIARAGRTPLLPVDLFRRRPFLIGLGMTVVFFAGVNSFFFLLFLHLQIGLGFPVLDASLIVVSWPLAIAVASTATTRWADTHGRVLLTAGSAIMATATVGTLLVVASSGADLDGWELVPSLIVTGLGMGLVAPTLLGVVVSEVRDTDAGAASGVLASAIALGASLGVAVAGAIFFALLSSTSGIHGTATAAAAALGGAARGRAFAAALAPTLWFHVGAYLLTGVSSLFLSRRPRRDRST